MADSSHLVPERFPGVPCLDRLELYRNGLAPAGLLDLGPVPARFVDAQGVPVAEVSGDGSVSWLSPRSPRPFERLHRPPGTPQPPVRGRVALVDDAGSLSEVPEGTALLVVTASTDGEDNEADLALVRAARQRAQEVGSELTVVPLGRRAPGRAQLLEGVRAAYPQEQLLDLTSATPADSGPGRAAGLVLFLTGLSGSGKSTIATALHRWFVEDSDLPVTLLDGDVVRRHLSKGLTFSAQDRDLNVRRIGWVAAEIARHGGTSIASPIAPLADSRDAVREMVSARGGRFFLIHVDTPLEECERRDRKGLYAQARAGRIPDFTGISSPYERPEDADLRLDTTGQSVEAMRDLVLQALDERGWLPT